MSAIVRLGEADDVKLAGGKGAALARMVEGGFKVPDGFVVTTEVKNMSQVIDKQILGAFDELGANRVAVRSSAIAEDGAKDAWAGQMDTFLNVQRDGLIDAIQKCWRSAGSERAKAYAKEKGLAAGRVAVVIQVMIDSEVSGVAFSANPVTNDKNQIVIEAVEGLADKLVSGEATPDNYLVDKRSSGISAQHIQSSQPLLNKEQLYELSETAVKLEEYFGFPVDIEWTFADNQLFILQSRPITTLG